MVWTSPFVLLDTETANRVLNFLEHPSNAPENENIKHQIKILQEDVNIIKSILTKLYEKSNTTSLQQESKERNDQKEEDLQKIFTSTEEIHPHSNKISSLIQIHDRIVTGGSDGSIAVCSFDIPNKKFNRDIYKENAHSLHVNSFCSLSNKHIASCSQDCTIKVWELLDKDISFKTQLNSHTKGINKLLKLNDDCFASCSDDYTVKIWKNKSYKEILTLPHNGTVKSIIYVKKNNQLVSCCNKLSAGISIWDLKKKEFEWNQQGLGIDYESHLIDIGKGKIALSSNNSEDHYPIIIIDCNRPCKIIQKIKDNFLSNSSLCLISEAFFAYIYGGNMKIYFRNDKEYTLYNDYKGKTFSGYETGAIMIDKGDYFIFEENQQLAMFKYLNNQH